MLSRRLVAARPLSQALRTTIPRSSMIRNASSGSHLEDPDMNGGYQNPPRVKRQFRDPYGDWWDKQERRNYGEPVHEDNDVLGIFTPEEYTHFTPRKGLFLQACFVGAVLTLCAAVYATYPDKPSVPREFEGGLESELGGPGAVRAKKSGDEVNWKW